MKKIDKQQLINEADPLTVAEYIGMNVVRKGSHNFISCPGHKARLGKEDRNISNAVLTDKGYHCFACHETVGLIDMVMEFLNCDFKTAIYLIAEACGGEDRFVSDNKKSKMRRITLSREDLELLGLASPDFSERHIVNASDTEPITEPHQYSVMTNGEYIVYSKNSGWSLTKLAQKDCWAYKNLIARKAREAMEKYSVFLSEYCSRNSEKSHVIYELFNVDGYIDDDTFDTLEAIAKKRYERAREIYQKYEEKRG